MVVVREVLVGRVDEKCTKANYDANENFQELKVGFESELSSIKVEKKGSAEKQLALELNFEGLGQNPPQAHGGEQSLDQISFLQNKVETLEAEVGTLTQLVQGFDARMQKFASSVQRHFDALGPKVDVYERELELQQ